jgi:endonuclease/exonuclease/phosphatase family metal-dependent hydrolase
MSRIKFLTYNIDGLNETTIQDRLDFLLAIILSEDADIIHLQEVTPNIAETLTRGIECNGYQASESVAQQMALMMKYYTLSFVKRSLGRTATFQRLPYRDPQAMSQQGRDLLVTQLTLPQSSTGGGCVIETINTHGESCGIAFKSLESQKRIAQVTHCLERVLVCKHPCLMAGDLNIRDSEATHVLSKINEESLSRQPPPHRQETDRRPAGRPAQIRDVGAVIEGIKNCQPTWILPKDAQQRSTNTRGPPAYRFDRVYVNDLWEIKSYRLIGTEAVFEGSSGSHRSYDTPSDHFGIVCELEVIASACPIVSHDIASQKTSVSSSVRLSNTSSSASYSVKPNYARNDVNLDKETLVTASSVTSDNSRKLGTGPAVMNSATTLQTTIAVDAKNDYEDIREIRKRRFLEHCQQASSHQETRIEEGKSNILMIKSDKLVQSANRSDDDDDQDVAVHPKKKKSNSSMLFAGDVIDLT